MDTLTVAAKFESLERITAWVDAALEKLNCPMKTQMQVDVAIDEIFSNIVRYAFKPGTGEASVSLSFKEDPKTVVITFSDRGIPYDPLQNPEPDVSLSAEERGIGGLGIFLVRKTMDSVHYQYRDGMNVLTIEKRF